MHFDMKTIVIFRFHLSTLWTTWQYEWTEQKLNDFFCLVEANMMKNFKHERNEVNALHETIFGLFVIVSPVNRLSTKKWRTFRRKKKRNQYNAREKWNVII